MFFSVTGATRPAAAAAMFRHLLDHGPAPWDLQEIRMREQHSHVKP